MITQVCDLINNSYYSTLKRLLLVVTVLSILVGFISYFYSPLVTFLNINHTFKNPSTDIPIVFFWYCNLLLSNDISSIREKRKYKRIYKSSR